MLFNKKTEVEACRLIVPVFLGNSLTQKHAFSPFLSLYHRNEFRLLKREMKKVPMRRCRCESSSAKVLVERCCWRTAGKKISQRVVKMHSGETFRMLRVEAGAICGLILKSDKIIENSTVDGPRWTLMDISTSLLAEFHTSNQEDENSLKSDVSLEWPFDERIGFFNFALID